jgi:TP901 family phage tail tape measure protein
MANEDPNVNININATDNSESELKQLNENLENASENAKKASFSFLGFGKSVAGLLVSLVSVSLNLARLAKEYLGLTVNIETTNTKLKVFDFFVQNTRKEITLSLGFLKRFADYLEKINFPIERLTKFIDLMGDFRVVIGIGKGENTIFENVVNGLEKAGAAIKDFKIAEFRNDIRQAIVSMALFAAQSVATFKSLKEGIARESAFSQASRTINGTSQEIAKLKTEIERLAATKLAVPIEDLYAVAGIAGAMGKSVAEIPAFIQIVSEGAIALDIPAQQLAESLGTIQTQLNLTEEGLVSLSDQVNITADSMPGKVKEMDIFEVLSTGVATAGKNFGLLKGETIALVGSLLSLGEAPETARTAIVNLLSALQNAKNQTPDFQVGLEQMGTSAEKLAADIKDKPLPTLQSLLEKMNGLSKAARLDIATKFLGKGQDAIALAKLVDNVDLFKEALKSSTDVTAYSGSVHAAYVKQIETVDAKLTLLKNSFNNLKESLTSTFLPAINLVVDGFVKMSNTLTEFSQNHPIFKTLAAVTVSILSVAGALRILKLGINAIGLLFGFSGQGGILAATLRTVRAAIIGIVGAWALFQTSGIGAIITAIRAGSAFAALRAILSGLFGGAIGLVIGGITLLVVAISNLLPVTIKWGETTATVGEVIKGAFDVILSALDPLIVGFDKATTAVGDFIAESLGMADFGDAISLVGREIALFFTDLVSAFTFTIESLAQIKGAMDSVVEGVSFSDAFSQLFTDINDNAEKTFGGATTTLDKFNKKVEDSIKKSREKRKLDEADKKAKDTGAESPEKNAEAAKKLADLKAQIQKEQRAKEIQDLRDAEAENIRIIQNSTQTQKQIDDAIFAEKIRSAKEITQAIKNQLTQEQIDLRAHQAAKQKYTQEELTAKKASLKDIETAYKAQIDALNTLEQQHRDKVIAIDKELKDLKTQSVAGLRDIERAGMTDLELASDKRLEVDQKNAQVRQLLNNGEYQQASELGKELNSLALEQAKAAAAAQKSGGDYRDVIIAQYDYQQSLNLTKEALEKQKAEELAKAEQVKTQADAQRVAYENVGKQIEELNKTLVTGGELKIIVDTSEVDVLKQKLDDLPKEKVINIKWTSDKDFTQFVLPQLDIPTQSNLVSSSSNTIKQTNVNQQTEVTGKIGVQIDISKPTSTLERAIKEISLEALAEQAKKEARTNQ